MRLGEYAPPPPLAPFTPSPKQAPAMAATSHLNTSALRNHPFLLLIGNPPSLHLPRLPNPARRLYPSPAVKCSASDRQSPNSTKPRLGLAGGAPPTEKVACLLGTAADWVLETLKSLRRPVLAAVLIGALLTYSPFSALAASGGRVGGRSGFSSHGPSSSRSYSASPRSGFSYSAPYFAPSPFGYGGGGGFYVGPVFGVGAGSGFFLLTMGVMALILLSGFLSDRSDDGSVLTATQKTSVIKLQVWL